jgi:hypothetical protein
LLTIDEVVVDWDGVIIGLSVIVDDNVLIVVAEFVVDICDVNVGFWLLVVV